MKKLNINGKTLLLLPVPEGLRYIHLNAIENEVCYALNGWKHYSLPPGDWQLIGKDPLKLTEEEAREIVEYVDYLPFDEGYEDYSPNGYVFNTALESLSSLLRANGIEKGIILKQN